MKNVLWAIFAFFLLGLLTGCEAFSQEVVKFRMVNHESYPLGTTIDGKAEAEHRIPANSSVEFSQAIDFANPRAGQSVTRPSSSLDRETEVLVAVRNLNTLKVEASRMCLAGPKVPVNLTYNGFYITCYSSRTYYGGIQDLGGSQ